MAKFHEEEAMGRAYDGALMKRLLGYARPYLKHSLLCVFLIVILVASELSCPLIVQMTIDDHITLDGRTYGIYDEAGSRLDRGVDYGDQTLILAGREKPGAQGYFKILKDSTLENEEVYYMTETETDLSALTDLTYEDALAANLTLTPLPAELYDAVRSVDGDAAVALALIYFVIIAVTFVLHYYKEFLLSFIAQKISLGIRMDLFVHLENMSVNYFNGNPVGRLVTRVCNDTENLAEMYAEVIINLFRDIFMLAGIAVTMVLLDWKTALIVFSLMPFLIIVTIIFRRYIRDAYRDVRVKLAKVNATLAEDISGMRITSVFQKQKKKYAGFEGVNGEYLKANLRQLNLFALFRPFINVVYYLSVTLIIFYGGGEALRGTMSIGVLFAFVNYANRFFNPIDELAEKFNIMQSGMASAERLFKIMDTQDIIPEPQNPVHIDRKNIKGRIEFKNVWFAYQDEHWILKDLSFTVEPGQTVAFVGATGAGKTSIMNLLFRFYDIQKGQILLDGVDIRDIPKAELRSALAMVHQDVFLFAGDIRSNIRLNREDISNRRIEEIARFVNADTFIENLPDRYAEEVTERGSTLSSGQRQLLSFARALAFDPLILILDEATANIDTETELMVQAAIDNLVKGRTNLVIAHRLSTIQKADKILVLRKGQLIESGSHEELLQKGGYYKALFDYQFKHTDVRPDSSPEPVPAL